MTYNTLLVSVASCWPRRFNHKMVVSKNCEIILLKDYANFKSHPHAEL